MTINLHDIERAYELGRAAERQKMKDLAGLINDLTTPAHFVSPERIGRVSKATPNPATAPKTPKAPVIASGVKKARKDAGPRTKGVKEAITSMIGNESGATVGEIVGRLGFKETSVRATLMGLKKSGMATQDADKRWILLDLGSTASGNSDHAEAHVNV